MLPCGISAFDFREMKENKIMNYTNIMLRYQIETRATKLQQRFVSGIICEAECDNIMSGASWYERPAAVDSTQPSEVDVKTHTRGPAEPSATKKTT